MIEPIRLLAFAFAGADFLFEVDRDGRILFATGAASGFTAKTDLLGSPVQALFTPHDAGRVGIVVAGMSPGDRHGPLTVTLASGERVQLSLCYLPQNDRISCTLVKPGKRGVAPAGSDPETGLDDGAALLAAAASAHSKAKLALVNLPNLPQLCAELGPDGSGSLFRDIGEKIKAIGAIAAARLSETGFGLISTDPNAAHTLTETIQGAVAARGIHGLKAEEVLVSLKGRGLTPEQSMLAVRHAVKRFTEGKLEPPLGSDLGAVFEQMLGDTVKRALDFNSTVADGAFDLVYEPIVDLKTGDVHHYEALSRFNKDESPAETIRFAEDLGLADCFDLAVAVKGLNALEAYEVKDAQIAINVSGGTLSTPSSFAMLAGVLAKKRALANRVLIELTETQEISDLADANRAIQGLREMGYKVGIDDFGAGAASLQYLHGLTIDFIKADGSLVQALGKSARNDALLRSIVMSCHELKIETIAEWIDSAEKLKRCKEIGFDYGQGRRFGSSLKQLPPPQASVPRARRKGVRETWA